MSGWLADKRVRLVGESSAIAAALAENGATLDDDSEIDVLVHVAWPAPARPAHELSHEEWRAALESGLDQRFHYAKEFADGCRVQRKAGAVVFVGAPEQACGSDHAAAAGALGNLTKTLAVEWARDGLRVNTVLTRSSGAALGNLVAYLASDYAAYVTGAVMGLDQHDA